MSFLGGDFPLKICFIWGQQQKSGKKVAYIEWVLFDTSYDHAV